jgi:predicted ATP-dependent endonuclease of OLD family
MLTRIRIENFKSLKNLDIELGLTNVLVGTNMSGKSNLIDAFRFIVDLITTHSPLLIDRCSIDDLVLFRRNQGATECIRPRDNAHFKKLVESGEIGLGELYYSGALTRA